MKPTPHCSFFLKNNKFEAAAAISEIGIFGAFIHDGTQITYNETGGYLCRTKKYLENEGGVATGYSVIDSLMCKKE
jgi:hypothetical protein